jgi:hypothetical protein
MRRVGERRLTAADRFCYLLFLVLVLLMLAAEGGR